MKTKKTELYSYISETGCKTDIHKHVVLGPLLHVYIRITFIVMLPKSLSMVTDLKSLFHQNYPCNAALSV